MRQRKYTLPRHTNLAKQGARTGAFFIDLAIFLAFTLAFFFGCFKLIFNFKIKPNQQYIYNERIYSALYEEDETGNLGVIKNGTIEQYLGALDYYYMVYLTGDNSKVKEGYEASKDRHEEYTYEWFNKNILEIDETNDSSFFVYKKVGDEVDKNQIGEKNPKVEDEVILEFIAQTYVNKGVYDLFDNESIAKATSNVWFYTTLAFSLSLFVGGICAYIVLPIILKNGQTVGKKVFKLILADSDGYKMRNTQLLMRYLPLGVIVLSLIFLAPLNLYVAITIILIMFLVSFALSMSSPKKMALHDFTARTIVVDFKTSIIFDNPLEEEQYIYKEDNPDLHIEQDERNDGEGEEPELSYEK